MKLETNKLIKSYTIGGKLTPILKSLNIEIKNGEFVVLSGASGAGKSTLLYQLSMLSRPTSGEVLIDGRSMNKLNDKERSSFRLVNFGFVFQDFALSRDLNAIENVALPLLCLGHSREQAFTFAEEAMVSVGMEHRKESYPEALSGGEQQRVAIARAIVTRPKVLFADEPTASLDSANSENVIKIIQKLHKEEGITVVMITHEEKYKDAGERVIELSDGKVI